MNRVRSEIAAIGAEEDATRVRLRGELQAALKGTTLTFTLTSILALVLLFGIHLLSQRSRGQLERHAAWLSTTLRSMSERYAAEASIRESTRARRSAEAALREAEDARPVLAAIVQSSDDAIIGETLDGLITSWNHAAQRILGYTAAEIVGKPISTLLPPDHSEDMSRIL